MVDTVGSLNDSTWSSSKADEARDSLMSTLGSTLSRGSRVSRIGSGQDATFRAKIRKRKSQKDSKRRSLDHVAEMGITQMDDPIGPIRDVMHRTLVKLLHEPKHRNDEVTKNLLKALAMDSRDAEIMVGFEHARDTVLREELEDALLKQLVEELKEKGEKAGGWAKTPPQQMAMRCAEIKKMKREVCLLRAEAHNAVLMTNLRNVKGSAPILMESPQERRDRVEEFWVHFRTRRRFEGAEGVLRIVTMDADEKSKKKITDLDFSERLSKNGEIWRLREGTTRLRDAITPGGHNTLRSTSGAFNKVENPRRKSSLSMEKSGIGKRTVSLPLLQGARSTGMQPPKELTRCMTSPQKINDSSGSLPPAAPKTLQLPAVGPPAGSRHRYLKACDDRAIVPTPLPFVTGHSNHLDAAGRDLTDGDLQAIVAMLPEGDGVQRVDLSGNAILTDKALTPLMKRLKKDPTAKVLQRLSLSNCRRIGAGTLNESVQLLQTVDSLTHLNLSSVPIGTRFQLPLCTAVGKHPTLVEVNLADTALGSTPAARSCCTALMSSGTITSLNLGWNCFSCEVFSHLGTCVAENETLRNLCVSNCSASCIGIDGLDSLAVVDNIAPVGLFLESLAHNRTLTRLDVSLNRMDFRTALVLEDALQSNKKLQRLNISQNALGTLGMRSIIRLIARDTSGVDDVDTDGCYTGKEPMIGEPTFSNSHPGARYVLHMHRPYHRAILRMLYKTCDRFQLQPDAAFQSITYSKGSYSHAAKDSKGNYKVVEEGVLTISFSIERALETAVKGVQDKDFTRFLAAYYSATKLTPSFKKTIPLLANWVRLEGKTLEQRCYVNALAKDFNLKVSHLEFMIETSQAFASETVQALLPSLKLDDAVMSRYLIFQIFPRLGELLYAHKQMLTQMDFNLENPTGHYKLDLAQCSDFAVAGQLLLLDAWEAAADRRRGRPDTSQRANRSHVRNETYQGRPLSNHYTSVQEWTLPEYAIFELDYISGIRPPRDCQTILSTETFEEFLKLLYDSECKPDDKIRTLRNVSHHIYITSRQMRTLLGNFPSQEQRGEAFVIFYTRIVDIQDSKLYTVRFDTADEVRQLQDRLGYANVFPFIQPENQKFSWDFSIHDQRLCACNLVKLALVEKPHNIRNAVYIRGDGTVDGLPLGVPRSWEAYEKLPPNGTFQCSYVCAPEDRKFEVRRKMCEQFTGFNVDVSESEVSWWTGLHEPPSDVIDFLEFLVNFGFTSHNEAFLRIDGADGNGVITLSEFREGLEEMKFGKFKEREKERIDGLFRYLDPGGEGSVSREEWDIIGQLWNEFDLSVSEFVEFLCRIFANDLDVAWEYIDDDGSGALDETEWIEAVEKIGYFGPSKVVFALLDATDDGNISKEEFDVLKKYMPPADKQSRLAAKGK